MNKYIRLLLVALYLVLTVHLQSQKTFQVLLAFLFSVLSKFTSSSKTPAKVVGIFSRLSVNLLKSLANVSEILETLDGNFQQFTEIVQSVWKHSKVSRKFSIGSRNFPEFPKKGAEIFQSVQELSRGSGNVPQCKFFVCKSNMFPCKNFLDYINFPSSNA